MKVYRYYFQGQTKYTRATCMLKLSCVAQQNCLFLNKENVFNWLWTVYSNTYVSNRSYVKTLIQCQNTNSTSKPSEEVKFETSIAVTIIANLTTYAASIPTDFWSFPGDAGCFKTESEFYPWYAVFSQHFTFSLHFTPGLKTTVCVLHWPRWDRVAL